MLYRVNMKSGHSFKFRGVVKFEFDAEKDRADVKMFSLIFGVRKFACVGVSHVSIGEDPDPAGDIMEFVNPKAPDGDATAETVKTYFHACGPVSAKDIPASVHEGESPFRREATASYGFGNEYIAPLPRVQSIIEDALAKPKKVRRRRRSGGESVFPDVAMSTFAPLESVH